MASHQTARNREIVAQEAARIIVEEGLGDYRMAKNKAAERLGLSSRRDLPRNVEIEAAVRERHRLFDADGHPQRLQHMRQRAMEAMRLLADFRPRLVGSVLKGTAHEHSDVNLHVFTDSAEDVIFKLMEHRIPYRDGERRLRTDQGYAFYPTLTFLAGDVEIQVTVFPNKGIRQPPLSPIDGKPMRRATADEVAALDDPEAAAS